MINIKGLDKALLLAGLYNNSQQLRLGVFDERGYYNLSYNEAKNLLETTTRFDYLYGRVLKVDLSGDEFDERLYDRDNGVGSAQRVVNGIRSISNVDILDVPMLHEDVISYDLEDISTYPDPYVMFRNKRTFYYDVNPEELYSEQEKSVEAYAIKNYDRVIYLNADQGVYFVVKDGKYGVISITTGEIIIPCKFEKYSDTVRVWNEFGKPLHSISTGNSRIR